MELVIKKEVARALGYDTLTPYGVSRDSWESWRDTQIINLGELSENKLGDLEAALERRKKVRGVGVLIYDIVLWRKTLAEGAAQKKARTVRQFEALLKRYLLDVPGHRIYQRHEDGAMLCYYVSEIEYHPPYTSSGGYRNPAYVEMSLVYEQIGGQHSTTVNFGGGDCRNVPVATAFAEKGYTSEVYAESEKRALYSVQCSQLGVKPEDLEEALLKVFERAKRWNAVMLLDEADVYVHERGNNMAQNAIVGVFLRVLEYQATILFLTTNRPEDVDDAIASRCIARIVYIPPEAKDAGRIWRVLADNAKIKIAGSVISDVVAKNPEMTGRDIKNILKLAALMDGAEAGITVEMVAYVQQFKPTGSVAVAEKRAVVEAAQPPWMNKRGCSRHLAEKRSPEFARTEHEEHEEWAAGFRCHCCGPCTYAMVTTTKCCAICGATLIREEAA